jgi:hypothetical protein
MSCGKWLFQYPNNILVETGSGGGGGIKHALLANFKEVHSIEINKNSHELCCKIFEKNSNVHLYCGDSLDILPKILSDLKDKATFLLDAHIMSLTEVHGKKICPILEELKMIINHSNSIGSRHSILIDDAKLFNGGVQTFENIKILDINKVVFDIDPSYISRVHRKYISLT